MLAPPRAQSAQVPQHIRLHPPPSAPPDNGWVRARRVALAAALICLLPAGFSYVAMLGQRSDSSLGIRTVEWLRDHGARGLVNQVESIYYSLNAPAKGGPALKQLPAQPGLVLPARLPRRHRVHVYRPKPIRPAITPVLPGEGLWHPTFSAGGAHPPVLVTSFRTDPAYPRLVAGVAWIDHTRTSTWLYPGIQEPAVNLRSRGPEEVPPRLRPALVATFNSGFKMKDAGGGVTIGGHTYAPLKNGLATFVRYSNGRVDVQSWSGGANAGPDIVYARQNLPLIVNHAKPNPNLSDGQEWGFTLGNAVRVWRSSVGVDARGNLIYAAAPDQTVLSLAAIMIRAGAVRAMELDINTYWTTFISYRHPGALGPASLLADMNRPPSRYLSPDDRDFFAVYLR